MSKSRRVYVLEHTIMTVSGNTIQEPSIIYYDYSQRQQFIEEYIRRKDAWYTVSIKAYYADLQEINVEDILNAI